MNETIDYAALLRNDINRNAAVINRALQGDGIPGIPFDSWVDKVNRLAAENASL